MSCERAHRVIALFNLKWPEVRYWTQTISKDQTFTECVILDKESFDPEAVFMEDIVDDEVLPRLSLAVDGLTNAGESRGGQMELPSDQAAANEVIKPSTTMPVAVLEPEHLEVYGWESNLWRKIRGYLGF